MPLLGVVEVLTGHEWCFVTPLEQIGGVVGRGDLQKPPVRMWLFGMVMTSMASRGGF